MDGNRRFIAGRLTACEQDLAILKQHTAFLTRTPVGDRIVAQIIILKTHRVLIWLVRVDLWRSNGFSIPCFFVSLVVLQVEEPGRALGGSGATNPGPYIRH